MKSGQHAWRPEATFGELQNVLQGTVEGWLNATIGREVKPYEVKHAANFLRKAIQGAGADGDPADKRVLLWLWMNTESYCPK